MLNVGKGASFDTYARDEDRPLNANEKYMHNDLAYPRRRARVS